MQLFYSNQPVKDQCTLDEQESRHAIKVLRLGYGSTLSLTDGSGVIFQGIIRDPSPKGCLIEIINSQPGNDLRDYSLNIAISPLKNPDRFEWFVEKAVEIGIDSITPVVCDHTEKPGIKTERIEKLVTTAMKQSLKTKRPLIEETIAFSEFIRMPKSGKKMIAHCNEGNRERVADIYSKGEYCTILIGPEGDFSKAETEIAISYGYIPVTLGPSRLRTETAGIAACHSIYFINL
jgi:16S rRNA (uracil1498-N3)-methyltransferase